MRICTQGLAYSAARHYALYLVWCHLEPAQWEGEAPIAIMADNEAEAVKILSELARVSPGSDRLGTPNYPIGRNDLAVVSSVRPVGPNESYWWGWWQ
jgi:hypothetical protein